MLKAILIFFTGGVVVVGSYVWRESEPRPYQQMEPPSTPAEVDAVRAKAIKDRAAAAAEPAE